MPNPTSVINADGSATTSYDGGRELTHRIYKDETFPDGWYGIGVYDGEVLKATIMRGKAASGERIAADFPGCDATYVITDTNGRITDG